MESFISTTEAEILAASEAVVRLKGLMADMAVLERVLGLYIDNEALAKSRISQENQA